MRDMSNTELRVAIAHLGITQEDLGQMLHVSARTIRGWLVTGVTNPPAAILIRIMVARRNWGDLLTIGYGGTAK